MESKDFSIFHPKMSWDERYELICDRFPQAMSVDWSSFLRDDPYAMGRILSDIIRLEHASSRPGKRKILEADKASQAYKTLSKNDYSYHDFGDTLKILQQNMTLREFSEKVGVPKTTLDRLIKKETKPDDQIVTTVARNLGKHPSFFLEWRIAIIVSYVIQFFEWAPESSVVHYNKVLKNGINKNV